jgi:hypothetical protein
VETRATITILFTTTMAPIEAAVGIVVGTIAHAPKAAAVVAAVTAGIVNTGTIGGMAPIQYTNTEATTVPTARRSPSTIPATYTAPAATSRIATITAIHVLRTTQMPTYG